jgi:hypothetical protein
LADAVTPYDDVTEAVRRFEEAENTTRDARSNSERDRDYYDGKQWTEAERAALEKRGQPVVTYNRIQRKINYLKGLESQTRKDPKGFPRTPGDDGAAQAATDALRFVCDDQQWDSKRSDGFESICVEGTGAIFVGAAPGKQGIDPTLIQVPWDRLYYDPYSRRVDFSDAAYMGIVTWLDMDEAMARWAEKGEIIEGTWARARSLDTYDDRPKMNMWADYKRRRVRFCEEYCKKKGVWYRSVFTQGGWVEDPEPSPYLDENGKPENPIKAVSAYVDRDNNRYGEVRAMISPQDEVNKRRSKGLHLINSRQTRSSRSAMLDPSQVKRELAKPDGHIIADEGEFEVLQTGDMAAANFQLLQEAKAEIDLLGPNAALAGKTENDQSGRAIMAQQQGGMVEVALLMDRLRHLSMAVYRAIWARIRQFWTEERWIRVTDDERNLKWVGLNAPRTMLEVAAEKLDGDPEAEMKLALLARDPRAQMVMEVKNAVAEIDVDIVIDEGMDTPMVQAEQFDTLTKIMPSLIQMPPEYAKMLVQASSLRDKDQMLETVEKMGQGAQIPPEMQQAMQEMQQALQQLAQENQALKMDAEGKQADRRIKGAEIELKGREIEQKDDELRLDAYRARTERMTAMNPPEPKRETVQ